MLSRWGPVLVLTLLALLYFFPLVFHPTQVLYGEASDLLAEHIPSKRFVVRSFHETGELPLWCPWQFAGTPVVHDIQQALFYPPHFVFLVLSEEWVGPVVSWLIVLHVLLAGLLMFVYVRHRGLLPFPATVAAAGYMFAGRWMLHLLGGGHYITIGLAWLPLVLLCLDRAIQRGSLLWATWAGLVFALLVLCTQPQWTFYAGLFATFSTLGTALEEAGYLNGTGERSRGRTARALGRWLGFGAWAVGLAVALAAVQLLPTLEAARHSTRAGGVAPEDPYESLRTLLFLVGPSLFGQGPYLMWEDRGGLTLLWAIAAVLAPLLRGGQVRYQAGLCAGMLLLAVFGAFAGRWLPVFNLFRQHPRILVVASLPIAYLVGVTTQALFVDAPSPRRRRLCFRVTLGLGVLALLATASFVVARLVRAEDLRFDVYWVFMPVFFVLALWLLRPDPVGEASSLPEKGRLEASPTGLRRALPWAVLLLADLWALTWPLVEVRPEGELFRAPVSIRYLVDHRHKGRVMDIEYLDEGSPLGQGAPAALLLDLQAVRGFNPIDVRYYREYLAFIADVGRPLRALESAVTHPLPLSFPLENRRLLDLLGVRYLLHPSATSPPGDRWQEKVVDKAPLGYSLVVGGLVTLPSYTISENLDVFPRAFVVPRARPLPPRLEVLHAMKTTNFREIVLLDGYDGTDEALSTSGFHPADIRRYEPNRVELEVRGAPGFLVLTDVWYPGWTATVDGEPVEIYRANHAFRAVAVSAGTHTVVFRFEPAPYFLGRRISLVALAAVAVLLLILTACATWRRSRAGS
ncbi:MAG: YfhO family protein [Planctomycetes bacterium]|nr:YfhO family protein [Planctomycetota bacterium]